MFLVQHIFLFIPGHLYHIQPRVPTGLQEDSLWPKGCCPCAQCENLISTEG